MVDISLILEEAYSLKTENLTYRIAGTLQIIVSTWLLIFFLDFVLCQSVVHTSCQLQVLSDFLDIVGTEFYTPAIDDTTVDIAVGSTENRRNLTTSIHPLTVTTLIVAIYSQVQAAQYVTESAVSTFEDELGWERKQATVLIGIIMLVLGSLSALGYGPLARFTVFGMQFLDFFDFLTNSVMMPIAAITTCLLVSRVIGVEKIEEEVTLEGKPFRRKRIFNFMIKYLCPIFAAIILISSVANALGVISM